MVVNEKKQLRIAIIGGGAIAEQQHIPSLLKIKGVEIVALCDKNKDLAKQVSERFGIGRCYVDFPEMLDKEGVDIIDICAPPQSHLALSTQAMAKGCHVLMEKPMALSLKEADQMVAEAHANRVKLCVVHNELFMPAILKARSMVSKGVIGEIVGINIKDTMPRDRDLVMDKEHWCHKLPGGIFGEMLSHPIYLASAFLDNLEPVVVYSRKTGNRDWLVADELRVVLENKDSLVTLTSSVNMPDDTMVLEIYGTKGNLYIDVWGAVVIRYGLGREGRLAHAYENIRWGIQEFTGTLHTVYNIVSGRHHHGHYTLIKRFIGSLQTGDEPPVSMESAREAVRLYELITRQI